MTARDETGMPFFPAIALRNKKNPEPESGVGVQ
jgi:hypothetical protein